MGTSDKAPIISITWLGSFPVFNFSNAVLSFKTVLSTFNILRVGVFRLKEVFKKIVMHKNRETRAELPINMQNSE
jgi:hypothetical protein